MMLLGRFEMIFFISKRSVSVVHIYYEESYFRSFTKEELIGFTEFLCTYDIHDPPYSIHQTKYYFLFFVQSANTGGLLGLFMGFSVVSIIEIIYFISLRPYCAHRRDKGIVDNRHVKMVEPSKKVWFVEDVDHGKMVQLNQKKNANKSKIDRHYPYND